MITEGHVQQLWIDVQNQGDGAPVRTRIVQSATSGEVILESISDQWLQAPAVKACVKLVHRVRAGDHLEYFSGSSQNWVEANVTKFRLEGCAGEFQINMKQGVWFTTLHQSIRLAPEHQPIPGSPATSQPGAKRQDVGARFEMTPGASIGTLDPSLFLQSSQTTQLPVAPPLPVSGVPADFWGQMQGLINNQTTQLNQTIVGVEQRLE